MNLISYLQIFLVYLLLIVLINMPNISVTDYDFLKTMLSMTSFVFAILLGFTITNRQNRFSKIKHSLRDYDATILSMYHLSIIFGKRTQNKLRKMLDTYLISQIDYSLIDFYKSAHLLLPIQNFILSLEPKTESQKIVLDHLLEDTRSAFHSQKQIIYLLGNKLLTLEWISIIVLYLIIIELILVLNNHSILSTLTIPIIGTALFVPIVIIKNLNNLHWHNQNWDWKSLTHLFQELNLSPYYPYKPSSVPGMNKYLKEVNVKSYLVATYPSKYPKIDDKIVETIKLK